MSNIHGLSSLKNNRAESGSSSEEEDNNRQGFYVGGSNQSGQQILGPRGGNNDDIAAQLFDSARNAGAEQISPEEANAGSSHVGQKSSVFQGGAYRLGGHGQESQAIPNASTQNRDAVHSPVVINFNVWQNGFSLNDGPLREFANPDNQSFLEEISRGQIPQELIQQHFGRKIDFHMIKKNVPYAPPKMAAFSGEGRRLGSVVPDVVGSSSAATEVIEIGNPTGEELKDLLAKAQEAVGLKVEEPTTRVQVRLPSVQYPIIGIFNQAHTVVDLRNFIVNVQPNLAFQPFQLVSTFPTKVIEDESTSLKEAGIVNSVVNVKYV